MPHVLFDEKWLREYSQRTGIKVPEIEEGSPAPKRPKYGNTKTQVDGMAFDSLHEARQYQELLLRLRAGADPGKPWANHDGRIIGGVKNG